MNNVKSSGITCFVIGHITKEGSIAPKDLNRAHKRSALGTETPKLIKEIEITKEPFKLQEPFKPSLEKPSFLIPSVEKLRIEKENQIKVGKEEKSTCKDQSEFQKNNKKEGKI